MAGRHFLSVLGTGNYSEVKYVCGEGEVATSYVQEAVLKLKMLKGAGYTGEDRITIFVTTDAHQRNWLDREYTGQELERMKGENPGRKRGLYSILQENFGITEDAARLIPLGATEEELWDIFHIIYEEIREGESLYVDITHSLRNIPIQMLSVIAYARTLKNVNVEGIYYGAFEAGRKNEEGITEAPIFDLVTFLDILDWSQAANSFVRHGNSDEIKALYEAQKAKRGNKVGDIHKVVGELSAITQGLETSRGCYLPEPGRKVPGMSVLKSYRSYAEAYGIMQKKSKKQGSRPERDSGIEPLSKLFDVVNEKLKVFDVEDNLAFGFAAIDWAIENGKTQQGFTALDETIKTWLCRRYGLDECLERHREGICKALCNLFCNEMKIRRDGGGEFSEETREEIYRKWKDGWEIRWNSGQSRKEKGKPAMSPEEEAAAAHKLAMELSCSLASLSSAIGSRRNSMNHFGYSNINQFGCRKLQEDLKAYYAQFKATAAVMEKGGEE